MCPAMPCRMSAAGVPVFGHPNGMRERVTMTNATITKPAKSATVVVPEGLTASRAAAAVLAGERLGDCLTAAKGASAALIVTRYGADIDVTAIRLAKRAADELSGKTKSRGGARADVLGVLHALEATDTLTDLVFVAAARTQLDAAAADRRRRNEQKKDLANKVNDKSATLAQRTAALEVLTGMDDADAKVKADSAIRRLNDAIMAAQVGGLSEVDALEMVHAAYAVKLDK